MPGRLQAWWASGGSRTRYEPELQPGLPQGHGGGDFSGQMATAASGTRDSGSGGARNQQRARICKPARPPGSGGARNQQRARTCKPARPGRGCGRHCQWPRLLGPSRKRGARRLPPATGAAGSKRNMNTVALEKRQCHDKECGDSGICSHGVKQQARAAAQVRVPVMILKIYSSNKGPGR